MRLRYERLFWDLDGTLLDPREGIVGSVVHALSALGIEPDPSTLDRFIGPPLRDGFHRYYGLVDDRLERAISLYRDRFGAWGWRKNRLYPGIPLLLERLSRAGVPMAVATSKPTVFAERVLDAFGLRPWLQTVHGATLDGRVEGKVDVLSLAVMGLSEAERARSLMIGDHAVDIEAAHVLGLRAVAVTYGYGPRADLEAARPDAWADGVEELGTLLGAPDGREEPQGGARNMHQ